MNEIYPETTPRFRVSGVSEHRYLRTEPTGGGQALKPDTAVSNTEIITILEANTNDNLSRVDNQVTENCYLPFFKSRPTLYALAIVSPKAR